MTRWDREAMTPEEVEQLKECPDCCGLGFLTTPSRNNLHRRVACAECGGKGYVKKPQARRRTKLQEGL